MPVFIPCPACHFRFSVEESLTGWWVRCPDCGNAFSTVIDEAVPNEAVVAGNPSLKPRRSESTDGDEAIAAGYPSLKPHRSELKGNQEITEAWKPMRWGLKMQIACVFAQFLGLVLAGCCIYYVLNSSSALVSTGRRSTTLLGSGSIAVIMFFIGSILALIGTVILPFSLFWLARIPREASVGRWAPRGLCSFPISSGIITIGVVLRFDFSTTPQVAYCCILVAAIFFCFGMFCISHILRASATFWNAAALGRQFMVCHTAFYGLIVGPVAVLSVVGALPNETLHQTTPTFLQRTELAFLIMLPVVYLLLMSWHLVLARRLLARIPIANTTQEPQVPIS